MNSTQLKEGDYDFVVTKLERARFPGSDRLPPSPMVRVTAEVMADGGNTTAHFNLILSQKMEWKLCAFFRCIGQKKHGERLRMDWNAVNGSAGRAHFKPWKYTDSWGDERTACVLDRFIDYDPKRFEGMEVNEGFMPEEEGLPFC